MQTLVLNASFEPMALIPWQRAMVLLCEGKVEVVEEYEDREVRSVTFTFKMPAVVRFLKWVKNRKKVIKFSRENIYLRDNGKCQYCSKPVPRSEYTYDHVLPKSKGGKTEWKNIVTCCVSCNQKKGGRTPEQAGMKLVRKPSQPTSLPSTLSFTLTYKAGMPEAWRNFLMSVEYWHGQLDQSDS